jgi:hypothetical protein
VSYRDEDDAAHARTEALQDEVRALREENEALKNPKAAPAPAPKKSKRAAAPASNAAALEAAHEASLRKQAAIVAAQGGVRKDYDQRLASARWRILLATLVVGPILAALPISVASFVNGLSNPDQSVVGIGAVAIGGIVVPSQFLRMLWPWIPVVTRDVHTNEPITSTRPRWLRVALFAVPLAIYLVGLGLLFAQKR